ncbi:MAG: hypothetical protein ACXWT5_09715 [Methylophilus sp.]
MNRAQQYVHQKLEEQKAEFGYIRAIIPKARKMGVSTYIAARMYHQITTQKHKTAVVLSDTSANADELFSIYKRYYDNIPPTLRPNADSYNSKSLKFGSIDSSLKVMTASSENAGRGATSHYLHLSEISSWPNQSETIASTMQTMKLVAGTEMIIESTAKGRGDEFYRLWNEAVGGEGSFIGIFLPWNLDYDNVKTIPDDFKMTPEEVSYADQFELTPEQINWRRAKISELGKFKFEQEYPILPSDCFNSKDTDALFQTEQIIEARKYKGDPNKGVLQPLILGVDPAEYGSDKSVICWRRGREVLKFETHSKKGAVEMANILQKHIDQDKPAKVFVDIAKGSAIVDILRSRGYQDLEMVAFGGKATDTANYFNMRAYIYGKLKEWFDEQPCKIPDDTTSDLLEGELTSTNYKYDKDGRLQLVSKDEIKRILGRSPDSSDALALTFVYDVGPAIQSGGNSAWNLIRNREPDYLW